MLTSTVPKSSNKFHCYLCDYVTSRKSQYDRHLTTGKHKMLINANNSSKKSSKEYDCYCGKRYNQLPSLSRHKKTCTFVEEKTISQNSGGTDNTELVTQIMTTVATQIINPLVSSHNDMVKNQNDMVKNQCDFQNLVVTQMTSQQQIMNEIIPKIGNTNCNNTMNNTTNNNNNKFNMNIYLNEKCKDAMTLSDFIDNLQISDEDFETTRTEGIISGLTDIFTKELRNLDVRKLPIHCSDIRRETFYIKEENEWVKDDGKKSILSRAIDKAKGMANKFLPVWIDDHQNCWKSESPHHTEWMNVITMRFGDGDPKFNEKNTKKIIKNIANEVLIDKETAMIDE